MTIKQLIEMFKYYTTGKEEKEIWLYVECEYNCVVLYCDKIDNFMMENPLVANECLFEREVKSWNVGSVLNRVVVYIKVLNNR